MYVVLGKTIVLKKSWMNFVSITLRAILLGYSENESFPFYFMWALYLLKLLYLLNFYKKTNPHPQVPNVIAPPRPSC
jgi:hypothetical protein